MRYAELLIHGDTVIVDGRADDGTLQLRFRTRPNGQTVRLTMSAAEAGELSLAIMGVKRHAHKKERGE